MLILKQKINIFRNTVEMEGKTHFSRAKITTKQIRELVEATPFDPKTAVELPQKNKARKEFLSKLAQLT